MPSNPTKKLTGNEFRCENPRCKKILADVEIKHGKVSILCKCGTMNVIDVTPNQKTTDPKNFVYNTPYQNRIPALIRK